MEQQVDNADASELVERADALDHGSGAAREQQSSRREESNVFSSHTRRRLRSSGFEDRSWDGASQQIAPCYWQKVRLQVGCALVSVREECEAAVYDLVRRRLPPAAHGFGTICGDDARHGVRAVERQTQPEPLACGEDGRVHAV